MEDVNQELVRLRQSIAERRYKRASKIVQNLGKGLTSSKQKSKRLGEIKRHLKSEGEEWFLIVVYVKHAFENGHMTLAGILTSNRLYLRRKFRQKRLTITEAFMQILGSRKFEQLQRYMEADFDWTLLNWRD